MKKEDWAGLEIEYALKCDKNVIPMPGYLVFAMVCLQLN